METKNVERQCKHRAEFYTCKRIRLLQYLKERGFMPVLTLPDVSNPRYNIWKFKNTPELEEAVEAYFEAIKHRES
jgi:hypothetical protein